jgi:hypothetical protein
MTLNILDCIPFQPDLGELLETLRIQVDTSREAEFIEFFEQVRPIVHPKVVYKVAFIEEKGEAHVVIDGVRFASRVLRVNLDPVHRVFPYVVTCGMELEDWQNTLDDFLLRFWADAIKASALECAFQAFDQHLNAMYQPGPVSMMNPGSLEDWPLPQQTELFSLLGDVHAAVGVRLTESFLMIPNKTVSGLVFPTETSFASCQLCPREVCPNRRAPYDAELFETKYAEGRR